jgi:hypothetical protein
MNGNALLPAPAGMTCPSSIGGAANTLVRVLFSLTTLLVSGTTDGVAHTPNGLDPPVAIVPGKNTPSVSEKSNPPDTPANEAEAAVHPEPKSRLVRTAVLRTSAFCAFCKC